jgi:hypothetical protein
MRAADFTSRAAMASLCTGDRGARKWRLRATCSRRARRGDSDGASCAKPPPVAFDLSEEQCRRLVVSERN